MVDILADVVQMRVSIVYNINDYRKFCLIGTFDYIKYVI